VPTVVLTIENR